MVKSDGEVRSSGVPCVESTTLRGGSGPGGMVRWTSPVVESEARLLTALVENTEARRRTRASDQGEWSDGAYQRANGQKFEKHRTSLLSPVVATESGPVATFSAAPN